MWALRRGKETVFALLLLLTCCFFHGSHTSASPSDLVYDFDTDNAWNVVASPGTTLDKSRDTAIKIEGASSLNLSYSFNGSGSNYAFIERDIASDASRLGAVDELSLWVYSPAAQPELRVWIKLAEADGSEYETDGWWLSGNQYQMDFSGWRKLVVPLTDMKLAAYSSDPDAGLQLDDVQYLRIGLDDEPDDSDINGSIKLDEFKFEANEPGLAYSMDTLDGWNWSDPFTSGTGSALTVSADAENAVEGTAGIKLQYSFSTSGSDWAYIRKDVASDLSGVAPSEVDRVSLWVYSPTAQPNLRLWVKLTEADGSEYESDGWWLSGNQYQMNDSGWRRVTIPLDDFSLAAYSSDAASGTDAGLQIGDVQYLSIGLDDVPDSASLSGSVTVDDVRFDAPDAAHTVTSWSDNSSSGSVPVDGKYEATFTSDATFANNDDPDVVETNAYITGPDGSTVSVPGFWYVGYERSLVSGVEQLSPTGADGWKIRYAPRAAGTYTYYLEIWDKISNQYIRYPSGNGTLSFTAAASSDKGFLQPSAADSSYLEDDDGSFFLGIGHNLAGWEWDGNTAAGTGYDNSKGTYDYDKWLTSLGANGANLTQFDFGEGDQLEWTPHATELPFSADWNGLTSFNPQNAWKMDYRFDKAAEQGIFYRVSLSHWEDFDTETGDFPDWGWNRNPYNAVNGGPVGDVEDFFTDRTAIATYKKYLRYVVARYGYSKNVLAWELWNEINLALPSYTDNADNKVTDWHAEMAAYLKRIDPNRHMVTTSYSDSPKGDNVWALDDIDLSTFHRYTYYNSGYPGGFPQYATEETLDYLVNARHESTDKPVIAGEFALSPGGDIQRDDDPDGIAFHNQLWASVMAKSFGTAMHWTWASYLDANDLYFHYKPLAEFFAGADLRGTQPFNNYKDTASPIQYAGLTDSEHAYLWVMDRHHTFIDQQTNTIAGQSVDIPHLDDATFDVTFYDTYTGDVLSTATAASSGHTLTVDLPTFQKDIAVKAVEVPGTLTGAYENLVADPGFEEQPAASVSSPWTAEGTDWHGVDHGLGYAHTAANNAFINTASTDWNALTQTVAVTPHTDYVLTGWVRNSNNFDNLGGATGGYFGVRDAGGSVLSETSYGRLPNYTKLQISFNSGANASVTVFAGYWAPGADSWIQLDDVELTAP